MPKPRTAPTAPALKTALKVAPKTHRTPRTTATPAVAAPVFDPAAHRAAIAQLAYRNWEERANAPGSPEDDWLRAENQLRTALAG